MQYKYCLRGQGRGGPLWFHGRAVGICHDSTRVRASYSMHGRTRPAGSEKASSHDIMVMAACSYLRSTPGVRYRDREKPVGPEMEGLEKGAARAYKHRRSCQIMCCNGQGVWAWTGTQERVWSCCHPAAKANLNLTGPSLLQTGRPDANHSPMLRNRSTITLIQLIPDWLDRQVDS